MSSKSRMSAVILFMLLLSACTPTIHLVADKPIEINMNITVEIRIAIEEGLDDMLNEDSGLF